MTSDTNTSSKELAKIDFILQNETERLDMQFF